MRGAYHLAPDHAVAAAAGLSLGAAVGALVVRPVHLHAGRDHLVLSPPHTITFDESESCALFEAVVDWLAQEPVTLRRLSGSLWELRENTPETTGFSGLVGASSSRAGGRNIDIWLPRGATARVWRRLMNEVQMLWHTHPVNLAREQLGHPPINALWLEGAVPAGLAMPYQRVVSDDPILTALAQASGATVSSPATWRASEASPDDRVLIDAAFWRPQPGADATRAWHEGWEAFEAWLAGSPRALDETGLAGAEIVLTGEATVRRFHVPRRPGWRFWRRPASMGSLLENEASG